MFEIRNSIKVMRPIPSLDDNLFGIQFVCVENLDLYQTVCFFLPTRYTQDTNTQSITIWTMQTVAY